MDLTELNDLMGTDAVQISPSNSPAPVEPKSEEGESPQGGGQTPPLEVASEAGSSNSTCKGKVRCPCKVCNFLFADMPKGSKYCHKHRSTVNAITSQLKAKAKIAQDDTELKVFEELRDTCGPPPSKFSELVLKFEQDCPSCGPGQSRKAFDFATEFQEEINTTRVKRGVKIKKMHKERALRFWMGEMDYSAESAEKKWSFLEKTTPAEEADEDGPEHSKLQLPIVVEHYLLGENETAHSKGVRCDGKRKKVSGEEELETMRKAARAGHASFGDSAFDKVGGAAVQALASTGCNHLGGPDSNGLFAGALESGAGGVGLKAGLNIGEESIKKKKRYDIEIACANLQDNMDSKIKVLEELATAAFKDSAHAEEV